MTSTIRTLLVSFLFAFLLTAPQARAVRPLDATVALVAGGECKAGYQDGSFTTALFNRPLGLAINADGSLLYVSDTENHCIRVIHLDQDNQVTTLAGTGKVGDKDGPPTVAAFNHPHGILCLPDGRLVVNDHDNQLLRLVDPKNGMVTTLAGARGGAATLTTGPATQVSMKGVRDISYLAAAHSILFTQPDLGCVKRLDLGSNQVSMVFEKNAQLPTPGALWCQDNKIYVADQDLPAIFKMDWKDNKASQPVTLATSMGKVLSLSVNGSILYALLADLGVPAQRFFINGLDLENEQKDGFNRQFNGKLVTFRSPWGDKLPQANLFPLRGGEFLYPIGFIPDPDNIRKFYVCRPDYNMIVSYQDLFGFDWNPSEGARNSNGLAEPEYPAKKPKNTYRILIVGDSRSEEIQNFPFQSDYHSLKRPDGSPYFPQNLALSAQLTRELNFLAALDDSPLNYEVFNYSKHGEYALWPSYEVPDIVKRNDIDLVILFMTDHLPYEFYFDHPITSEGIPAYPKDMEYLMKPALERIPSGTPRKFYDICKAHGWVEIVNNSFKFDQTLLYSPEVREPLIEMYGKLMDVLNHKLTDMRTSGGQPVRMMLCNMSTCRAWEKNLDMSIWRDVAKKYHFEIWDLNDQTNALGLSYYPLTGDGSHLNPDGATFYARLFAHELIRQKLIPYRTKKLGE